MTDPWSHDDMKVFSVSSDVGKICEVKCR
jgi:hypothetical protein